MLDQRNPSRLANLWDADKARPMSEAEQLLYRSNLLGSDKRITNFGGGNTSAKVMEARPADRRAGRGALGQGVGRRRRLDPARRLRHALHGQAQGAEAALSRRRARGRDGRLPAALHLQPQPARRLHRHAAARLRAPAACRPHASRRHHRHRRREGFEGADGKRSSVDRSAGCPGSGRASSWACGWRSSARRIRRRAAWCWRATACSPGAIPPRPATEPPSTPSTGRSAWLEEDRAAGGVRRPQGGAAAGAGTARDRRQADAGDPRHDRPRRTQGRPFRRQRRRCWNSSTPSEFEALAALGTSCPDHFLRTKIRPLVVDFDPGRPDLDATIAGLGDAVAAYREGLRRLLRALQAADSPAMRDPNAVVYLVPGVGMITFARDKATARISGEFYVNAINVMRGASSVSTYRGLPEQEAFDIEYWLLEEAKLQRMPKPKSARRQDRARHRRRRRHRQGDRAGGWPPKAPAWCSPTSTGRRSTRRGSELASAFTGDAVRAVDARRDRRRRRCSRPSSEAAVEFGGLDILVSNAGISSAAPVEETALSLWNRNMGILATGYFLVSREAFRLMKTQATGGAIVFIASKNGLAASPNASAYCTAKAAEIHLARCLALEGADSGHPRQHGQSGRGAARLQDLDRRVARAACRRLQHGAGRAGGALSQALDAEALRAARGRRRGGLFLRLRHVGQVDRQHHQRRRRQRAGLHALRRKTPCRRSSTTAVVEKDNEPRRAALEADYDALGEQLARRGIDIDAIKRQVAAFGVAVPSWGVGTGGTRFARFPGRGEPRDIFDKLDDCAVIHQLARATPTRLAAHPVGQGRRPGGAEAEGGRPRPRLRRHELQHLPGPARPGAFLQVRLALAHRRGHAPAGDRAQSRMHRDRPGARLEGADGLDRRRLELSRPEPFHQRLRALSRLDEGDLRGAARRLARLHRAQDLRAGLLFDRRPGLGHQLHRSPASWAPRPSASSISATMRRTSTSR